MGMGVWGKPYAIVLCCDVVFWKRGENNLLHFGVEAVTHSLTHSLTD